MSAPTDPLTYAPQAPPELETSKTPLKVLTSLCDRAQESSKNVSTDAFRRCGFLLHGRNAMVVRAGSKYTAFYVKSMVTGVRSSDTIGTYDATGEILRLGTEIPLREIAYYGRIAEHDVRRIFRA